MAGREAPMTGEEFISIGLEHGWTQIPNKQRVDQEGLMLERPSNGKKPEKITYWPDSDDKRVRTYLPFHPRAGPGQQFRRPTRDEMISMLTTPTGPNSGLRRHTNTGYRFRKNDKGPR